MSLGYLLIIAIVVLGGIGVMLIGPSLGPSQAEIQAEERKARMEEAKIRLLESRITQLPEQTRGITERYRLTTENRINSLIRQQRQEIEIAKLQAQVELLRRELGKQDDFTPDA